MASFAEVLAGNKPPPYQEVSDPDLSGAPGQQQQRRAPILTPPSHASPPASSHPAPRPKPAQPLTITYNLPPDLAGQFLRAPFADKLLTFTLFAPIAHADVSTQSLREAFQTGLQQALRTVSELQANRASSSSNNNNHLPLPIDIPLPSCHFWRAGQQQQGPPTNWGLYTLRFGLPSEQADALRTALTSKDHMGMVLMEVPGRGQCAAQLHGSSNTPGPAGSTSLIRVEFDRVITPELATAFFTYTRAFAQVHWVHSASELPRLPPTALNGASRHSLFALVEGGTRILKARRANLNLNAITTAKSQVSLERVLLSLPAAPQLTPAPPVAPLANPSAITKKRNREEQQHQHQHQHQQQQAPPPQQTTPQAPPPAAPCRPPSTPPPGQCPTHTAPCRLPNTLPRSTHTTRRPKRG